MRLLADVLRHIDRTRFRITLLVLAPNLALKDEFPDDVAYRILDGAFNRADSLATRIAAVRAIAREGRRHDLIVGYSELTPTYLAAVGGLLARRPVIGWIHIHLSDLFRRGLRPRWAHVPILRIVYPRLRCVVGVSKGVTDDLARAYRLRNALCIPNCSDLERIRRSAAAPLPPGMADLFRKPVLITVAGLAAQKALHIMIAAHAKAVAAGADHTLVIAGEGPLAAELRALCTRLGVSESVKFVGFVTNPYPLMVRARGFVLSSRFEGFPLVIVEALALGVPVISTRVTGVDEALDEGRFGPIVPVDDVDALAAEMKRLLMDDLWHDDLARGAVRAAKRYDCARIVPRIEALFDRVLSARPG